MNEDEQDEYTTNTMNYFNPYHIELMKDTHYNDPHHTRPKIRKHLRSGQ
jgi:hypothetical protein